MFKDKKKSKDDAYFAFVPSAIAILEKPPARHYRLVTWIIVTFVTIVILWLCFAKVDIVVSARGKIVPAGKAKIVQATIDGSVKELYVRDGMSVSVGDPLIELNNTSSKADKERLQTNLKKAWLTVKRLKIELGLEGDNDSLNLGESAAARTHEGLLGANIDSFEKKIQQARNELDEANALRLSFSKEFEKQEAKVAFLKLNAENSKRQADQGLIARREAERAAYDYADSLKELERLETKKKEMTSKVRTAQNKIKNIEADRSSQLYEKLAEAEFEYNALGKELVKAEDLLNSQTLRAPVSGIVQQLEVNTIGGFVSRGQKLLVIVPEDLSLQLDAQILNKDIGFVDQEQLARVKVDAFEYTRYGFIDGNLEWVGSDSFIDEKLGEVYPARIELKEVNLPNVVNGRTARVMPGMTASVDLVIGERNLIEYFIAPILRYKDESLRER